MHAEYKRSEKTYILSYASKYASMCDETFVFV